MDLTTHYMGLTLSSPLVASSSPFNGDIANLLALQDAGAGAVVLPSLFVEQLDAEARSDAARRDKVTERSPISREDPEPDTYQFRPYDYLDLVRCASRDLDIPLIASLNGASVDGWTDYAVQLAAAGASALELNIYYVPSDLTLSGREVELRYLDILRAVRQSVTIPVAVKLGPYFSAPGHMAKELAEHGADALVLFNRFYQPDIDTARLKIRNTLELSRSSEMRLPLLWIAILHRNIRASLAASTGVHTADDVIQFLLAGADVVMTTSAILMHGATHIRTLLDGLKAWLESREMKSLERMRGMLSQSNVTDPLAYQRANYLKILQTYHDPAGNRTMPPPARHL